MKIADINVTYVGHYGTDLTTVNAARVSFNKESYLVTLDEPGLEGEIVLLDADARLIKYLAKHKHFSPFNHSFISVRVKAPIFVARQLVKHKFMPWNEVSRRYVDEEPEFFFPEYWRKRSDNVKQGSSDEEVFNTGALDKATVHECLSTYTHFLNLGVAPEQARMLLPQNMMTEWIWSGTLNAFCDMLRLRLDPHTQYESRIVANKILEIVSPLFPVSVAALLGNTNE